jgi:hypothetical protein
MRPINKYDCKYKIYHSCAQNGNRKPTFLQNAVPHIFSGGRTIAFGLARGDECVFALRGGDCALQLGSPLGSGPQLEGGHLGLNRTLAHLERGQRVELCTQRGDLGEFDESRLLL